MSFSHSASLAGQTGTPGHRNASTHKPPGALIAAPAIRSSLTDRLPIFAGAVASSRIGNRGPSRTFPTFERLTPSDTHKLSLGATMKRMRESEAGPLLSSLVAPEDLHCGDYIAAINVLYQYPSYLWGCDESIPHNEPVQIRFRAPHAGTPLKVKALSLPFVFVALPSGKTQTMDVRQTQFVRLDSRYAETVWKSLKS